MNVFIQEFRMKEKSILIWSLSIAGFIIFYMSFFPGLAKDRAALESVMESFPKEMLQALGLREGLSISSLIGYFALTFTMIQLALAIQSANYGFSILSIEERELTADFLMTKPISRGEIYWSKFLAAFISLIITSIIVGVGIFISLKLFNNGENYRVGNILKLIITIPLFQLMFLSLGMIISLLFKKIRSVLSFSMGLSIGLYIINAVGGIIGSDTLGYLTPFYYFEPGEILKTGGYDIKLISLALTVIAISLISSYILYNKRDIDSV